MREYKWGWASWSNITKSDGKGEFPWHGRASIHIHNESARIEWNLRSTSCGIALRSTPFDEDTWRGSIALPPVALYWGIEVRRERMVAKLARWVAEKSRDMGSRYSGSELSLRVFDWAIWWSVFADDHGWTSDRPKWRDGNWRPLGMHKRQGDEETLEERPIIVMMPERSYTGRAKLQRSWWGFTKLPRVFDKPLVRVHIDMDKGEGIPVPGKGENSWDCDEDALHGCTMPADSIREAIGRLEADAKRIRRRHGDDGWQPEVDKSVKKAGLR